MCPVDRITDQLLSRQAIWVEGPEVSNRRHDAHGFLRTTRNREKQQGHPPGKGHRVAFQQRQVEQAASHVTRQRPGRGSQLLQGFLTRKRIPNRLGLGGARHYKNGR